MTVLLLNILVIAVGSVAGSLLKKRIRQELLDGMMLGIAVCVVYIGATGISSDISALALLFAYAVGCLIGYGLDLDGKLTRVSEKLEQRFSSGENKLIGPGMNFFLISCSGAFTVNACFMAGTGDYSLLMTKLGLDLVFTLALSSAQGIGVAFSIIPVTLFQGALILLSGVLAPLMTETMIRAFASAGSLVAVLIGTNMLGVTRIKIVNFLPAVFLSPFTAWLAELLSL